MASIASDSSLDDLSDNDSWETELEIALLKNAELAEVKSICQLRPVPSRLRRDLWRLCLAAESTSAGMSGFTDIYDLQFQEQLHSECDTAAADVLTRISEASAPETELVEELPTSVQLSSIFESVLTHFSQTYAIPFVPGNSWIQILSTLYVILRPSDRDDLYLYFTSLYHRFIASGTKGSLHTCSAFRLLLQYHEPELCNFLDSHKLGPETYAKAWFESLFAGHLSDETLPAMWDIYFLLGEPQFGMLVALILLVNAKNSLMQKEKVIGQEVTEDTLVLGDSDYEAVGDSEPVIPPKSRDEILAELRALPHPMQSTDLSALVDITKVYARKTPNSFYTHYLPFLFGAPNPSTDGDRLVNGALALLVSVEEVLSAAQSSFRAPLTVGGEAEEFVRFLLVDCRPADQYNAGHLATAFYLDTELMLSNPPEFNTSVQVLLQTQKRGIASGSRAVGEHIVFMGSGRQAEDRVANMVIAHFLRLNTPYVSMVDGGYGAFHEALGPLEFNRLLVCHDEDFCFVCTSNRGQAAIRMAQKAPPNRTVISSNIPRFAPIPPLPYTQPIGAVFSKFSKFLRNSSPSKTPQTKSTANPPTSVTSQSASKSPSYRNTAAVFSIDDNDDEDDESREFILRHNQPGSLATSFSLGVPGGNMPQIVNSLDTCQPGQLISLRGCSNMPGVKASFDCTLIGLDEIPSYPGVILVLEYTMVVVREREKQLFEALGNFMQKTFLKKSASNAAESEKSSLDGVVEVVFPFNHLTKITSKKITPEIITFHCIRPGEDLLSETQEAIRLLIPKAGDAVKVIKDAVFSTNGIS
ncbi:hypothetical protein Aperf_G00000008493 [Anoplocephala perfoliata]